MKRLKMVINFSVLAAVIGFFASNGIAQGFLPAKSLQDFKPGTGCDEMPYSGMVVNAILEATNGQDADAIEIHYRKGKAKPYKAKRVRIKAADRMAFPVQKKDGSCIRIWDKQPFTTAQLNQLLTTEESLKRLTDSDLRHKSSGKHNTTDIYLILKQ